MTTVARKSTIKPEMNAVLGEVLKAASGTLLPQLVLVELRSNQLVVETGSELQWAYFPIGALFSTSHVMQDGSSVGISLCGNEGVIGSEIILGARTAIGRSSVVQPGFAYRLSIALLRREIEENAAARNALLEYEKYLLGQIVQVGACARLHGASQRLCRLLLCLFDRSATAELELTQECIAGILGIRRESVSEAASLLQRSKTIHYSRGRIQLLDRSGLEHRSCECYHLMKSRRSGMIVSDLVD